MEETRLTGDPHGLNFGGHYISFETVFQLTAQLTFVGEKAECTDGAGTGWMGWDATCPALSTQLGLVRAGVGNSWTLKVVSNFSVSFAIGSSGFYGLWSYKHRLTDCQEESGSNLKRAQNAETQPVASNWSKQ